VGLERSLFRVWVLELAMFFFVVLVLEGERGVGGCVGGLCWVSWVEGSGVWGQGGGGRGYLGVGRRCMLG